MEPLQVLSALLLGAGCFFLLTGAAGVLRFPDFHSRMHPAAKGDTLGQMLVLGGLALHLGFQLATLKLAIIVLFLFLTAPTATHAMAHSAWLAGSVKESVPEEPDEPGTEERT
jgi:multicomponent Na+:H+ antiporter subunit G